MVRNYHEDIGKENRLHHSEGEEEAFWQFDEQVGEAPFFGEQFSLRLKAHMSQERKLRSTEGAELTPLKSNSGDRLYVLARPYILEPQITLTIDLSAQQTEQGVVGRVDHSQWAGMRHFEIGQAQAWFYPEKRLLVLWECYLNDRFRQNDPGSDEGLNALWHGFEQFLLREFAESELVATPSWEPLYEDDGRWQAFLVAHGYRRYNAQAFIKNVPPEPQATDAGSKGSPPVTMPVSEVHLTHKQRGVAKRAQSSRLPCPACTTPLLYKVLLRDEGNEVLLYCSCGFREI